MAGFSFHKRQAHRLRTHCSVLVWISCDLERTVASPRSFVFSSNTQGPYDAAPMAPKFANKSSMGPVLCIRKHGGTVDSHLCSDCQRPLCSKNSKKSGSSVFGVARNRARLVNGNQGRYDKIQNPNTDFSLMACRSEVVAGYSPRKRCRMHVVALRVDSKDKRQQSQTSNTAGFAYTFWFSHLWCTVELEVGARAVLMLLATFRL